MVVQRAPGDYRRHVLQPGAFVLLVCLHSLAAFLVAGEPETKEVLDKWHKGADSLGDPLPRGAIRRFGSKRLSHDDHVSCVAYSPDGKWLASGGYDATVRIWNAETHEEVQRIAVATEPKEAIEQPPPHWVRDLVWSPKGDVIYACSDGDGIQGWQASDGKRVQHFPQEQQTPIHCLTISADGNLLAAGGTSFAQPRRSFVFVWDLKASRKKHHVGVQGVSSLSFSADSKLLAIGEARAMRLLNVVSGEFEAELQPLMHASAIAFSPDGKHLAAADAFGRPRLHLWDVATRQHLRQIGGKNWGTRRLLFSPDSSRLLSVGARGEVQPPGNLWEVSTGKLLRAFFDGPNTIDRAAFSPDGKVIATAGGAGARITGERAVRLWDTGTGREIFPVQRHRGEISSIAISPDGGTLATASWDETVQLWNMKTGNPSVVLPSQNSPVRAVKFSPDGRQLATGSSDQFIRLWELPGGKLQGRWRAGHAERHPDMLQRFEILSLAYSPDGKNLAVGEGIIFERHMPGARVWDSPVTLWNLANGNELHSWKALEVGMVSSVAFSPDGKLIASGGLSSNIIYLWNAKSDDLAEVLVNRQALDEKYITEGFSQLLFSPDGRTLISLSRYTNFHNNPVSYDATEPVRGVRVWDLAKKSELFNLAVPRNSVQSIALSPDGKLLLMGQMDGMVTVWDLAQRKRVHRFVAHRNRVSAMEFTPDSQQLVTASWDTTAVLWNFKLINSH